MICRLQANAILVVLLGCIASHAIAAAPWRIYVDADYSNHPESAISIEQGIRTAIDMYAGTLPTGIEIVRKDHRGNSLRSLRNIKAYLRDDRALTIFSGMHSPPLLTNRDFINTNKVLFLVPWAAAGPITRAETDENWIFRLSIDDRRAGQFLADYAVNTVGARRPLLLLENTGWGKSNLRNMAASLKSFGIAEFDVEWFDWSLGEATANAIAERVRIRRNDAVLLVANAHEGSVIVKALGADANHEPALTVISHWGITGGNFHTRVPPATRDTLNLTFLQTRFSFLNSNQNPLQKKVLARATQLFPDISEAADIRAPTGFIHAFDLTSLLTVALAGVDPSEDIVISRQTVRGRLENLSQPVDGLIKQYNRPFQPYLKQHADAHEALVVSDYAMARFGNQGQIYLLSSHPQ